MLRLALGLCLTVLALAGNSKSGYYRLVEVDPATKSQGAYSSPAAFGGGQPPMQKPKPSIFSHAPKYPQRGPVSPFSKEPPRAGPVSPFPIESQQPMEAGPWAPPQQVMEAGPWAPPQQVMEAGPWASQQSNGNGKPKKPSYSRPQEDETPKPYQFNYVAEAEDGSSSRKEQSDGNGKVTGSYSVMDADGRVRTVEYVADAGGFRAKVMTNEQGTESKNPADVVLESDAPEVDHSQYTPPPAPRPQPNGNGGHRNGNGHPQGPSQGGNGGVKKFLLVPVDPKELSGQKSVGPPPPSYYY